MEAKMLRKGLAIAVILLFIGLAFAIPINANVSKSSLEPVPDLDCDGFMDLSKVQPGETVTGTFTVANIGEPYSELDWEVESYPDWSVWTIYPLSGLALTPEDGEVDIDIEVVIEDLPEEEIWDEVKFVNSDNPDDFCCVSIHYDPDSVPVVKNIKQKSNYDASIDLKVQRIRDLVQSIDLRKIIVNPDALVDALEEISSILEEEDVRNYIEKTSEEDCGCEDESTTELEFPIICLFFGAIDAFTGIIRFLVGAQFYFLDITLRIISEIFNCNW